MGNKTLEDIKNIAVRKEVFKLLEYFEEGFINGCLELVICHPVNPVDVDSNYGFWHGKGKNIYCNYYFGISNCESALDVKRKVLEYWSRHACKTEPAGTEISNIIQNYVRYGINEYLKTSFSKEDFEIIYQHLGNGINSKLCEKFIKSKFNLKVLTGGNYGR